MVPYIIIQNVLRSIDKTLMGAWGLDLKLGFHCGAYGCLWTSKRQCFHVPCDSIHNVTQPLSDPPTLVSIKAPQCQDHCSAALGILYAKVGNLTSHAPNAMPKTWGIFPSVRSSSPTSSSHVKLVVLALLVANAEPPRVPKPIVSRRSSFLCHLHSWAY